MKIRNRWWVGVLLVLSLKRPWITIASVVLVTVIMGGLSGHLEFRMNWTDLLPETDPTVQSFRTVQDRFGEPNLIVALEGERDDMVALAEILGPRLEGLPSLYNVQWRLSMDFYRNHGFMMMKPELFRRSLDMFRSPDLVGILRGINDDYEREYVDSDTNLKRDEVDIARSVLGIAQFLELLNDMIREDGDLLRFDEASDALLLGEPWLLSLDREMLLIACTPAANMALEVDSILTTVAEVRTIIDDVTPDFPTVAVSLTGMAKIMEDEMESIGLYTQFLTLGAVLLIYLLLVRTFRSWVVPLLAIIPLVVGIIWTTGLLYLLFGGLNLFTAMIMLVLLGLGIDFSIHLIARFQEALSEEDNLEHALRVMLEEAGVGVLTGALTTAMAFLMLMTAETHGVFEFGAASGIGVVLTLSAIFILLPAILTVYYRRRYRRERAKHGDQARIIFSAHSYDWLGTIARTGWRYPAVSLIVAVIILGACIWAMQHISFEYNFLELEPAGLTSVALQYEIPERFGMTDHFAWLVTQSVEESRRYKKEFEDKAMVGDVISISDYIPSNDRIVDNTPLLREYQNTIEQFPITRNRSPRSEALTTEITRLWDNLDLMSNLAFVSGLDRIVKVIDPITGYDTETDTTDSTAILPTLIRNMESGIDTERLSHIDSLWTIHTKETLSRMANPEPATVDMLPEVIRKSHLPRSGEGYLVQIFPRQSIWTKEDMVRFAEQTSSVHEAVAGTEQLFLVMIERTLEEGTFAAQLALVVIAVLVLIHFRGPFGLLALVPLGVGALIMLGLMYLFGMKYNYMNFIAVPIILGIGIDDGVHALHRFRHQRGSPEKRVYDTFRFIGRAILLTSLTTMIGFGSVAFYSMRGMASFGLVLFLGVGACFIATITMLPPLLRLVDRTRSGKSEQ